MTDKPTELELWRLEAVKAKARLDKLAPLNWSAVSRDLLIAIADILADLEHRADPMGDTATMADIDRGDRGRISGQATARDRANLRAVQKMMGRLIYKAEERLGE